MPAGPAGRLVPPRPARIEVQLVTGEAAPTSSTVVGSFVLGRVVAGRYQLRCRTVESADVVTGWAVL